MTVSARIRQESLVERLSCVRVALSGNDGHGRYGFAVSHGV